MKPDVVGVVDETEDAAGDSKENKSEIDWCQVFNVFARHDPKGQAEISIGDDKKQHFHVAFVCAAGPLLQVCKFTLQAQQKVSTAHQMKSFNETMTANFKGASDSSKKTEPLDFKLSCLGKLHTCFPKFIKAAKTFNEMVHTIEKIDANLVEEFKPVWTKIQGQMAENMKIAFMDCNEEIQNMQKMMSQLFLSISKNHRLPSVFQDEKLDREATLALCNDQEMKHFLSVFLKVSCLSDLSGACFVFVFHLAQSHHTRIIPQVCSYIHTVIYTVLYYIFIYIIYNNYSSYIIISYQNIIQERGLSNFNLNI